MDERLNDESLGPELERALGELGSRAARSAARLDSARVAAQVVERLRAERARPFLFRDVAPRHLAVAAALVVTVISGAVLRAVVQQRPPVTGAVALPLGAYADTLSETQARAILEMVAEAGALNGNVVVPSASVTIEDLNETELRTLLQSLERTEE